MKSTIPFRYQDEFEYGEIHRVSPLIRRIVAKNPSRFTYLGTGTYIVGEGEVAVVDPGPLLPDHIKAIAHSLSKETITHIVITHTHNDHSPAARPLQQICGAPIYGGDQHDQHDSDADEVQLEEEIDHAFAPDIVVTDGDVLNGNGWNLEAVHTPGHMKNHFCFRLPEEHSLFTGDHIMGWSTTVIIPPYGSMREYVNSLKRLTNCGDQVYYPTHGPPIRATSQYLDALIQHRIDRENTIITSLRLGLSTVRQMVAVNYSDVDESLHGAAACSLFATLIKLVEENRVICDDVPKPDSEFRLAQ